MSCLRSSYSLHSAVNVALEMSDYRVSEDDGSVRVCASLEGELERSIIVNITTGDVSALGESY